MIKPDSTKILLWRKSKYNVCKKRINFCLAAIDFISSSIEMYENHPAANWPKLELKKFQFDLAELQKQEERLRTYPFWKHVPKPHLHFY